VNSGDIQAVVAFNSSSRSKRSSDGGVTWHPVGINGTRSLSEFDQRACELHDGEVVQFNGLDSLGGMDFVASASTGSHFSRKVSVQLLRSHDDGLHQRDENVNIEIPPGLQIVRMSHSNIIAVTQQNASTILLSQFYGQWTGVDGTGKYRVGSIRSNDAGTNWFYTSTVAWDALNHSTKVGPSHELHSEGFDEASLLVTDASTGLIACFMRTGDALYRALSVDLGSSWSTADPIAPQGVAPVSVRTSRSGVVAVVYGRPGNYLRLSLDGARSFTEEWCFLNQSHDPFDGGQYDAVVPIPGTDQLLLVYSDSRTMYESAVFGTIVSIEIKPKLKSDDIDGQEMQPETMSLGMEDRSNALATTKIIGEGLITMSPTDGVAAAPTALNVACSLNGHLFGKQLIGAGPACHCVEPWQGARCNRLPEAVRASYKVSLPGTVVAQCPDPSDCTEGLSAALRAGGGRRVFVPVRGSAAAGHIWQVRGFDLWNDTVFLLEERVVIVAKRNDTYIYGCNPIASLGTATNARNVTIIGFFATLTMHRDLYDDPTLCPHSEDRMALAFRNVDSVSLHGLVAKNSGGDGLYIDGCGKAGCRTFSSNILVEDCTFDRNYRQGMSVISVENMTTRNCTFSYTGVPYGTAPMAGIDLEPDEANQRLVNVTFTNCTAVGNRGAQISFYGASFNGGTENTSVTFLDCVADGGAVPASAWPPTDPRNETRAWASPGWFFSNFENGMRGAVTLEGCATRDVWDWGLHARYIQPGHMAVKIAKSTFTRTAVRAVLAQTEPIVALNETWPTAPIAVLGAGQYGPSGGIAFSKVVVNDTAHRFGYRPWLDVSAGAPGAVEGDVTVCTGGGPCTVRGSATAAAVLVVNCQTCPVARQTLSFKSDNDVYQAKLKTEDSVHTNGPRWSWDTVQTYIHCANITGEWNREALNRLAKQSFVVFEKNHKLFYSGADGGMNTSAETKIAESCRLVKQINPNTDCYMYTENDVARTYFTLGHWFDAHPDSALHCPPGKLVKREGVVNMDASGKKHEYTFLAYDFDDTEGRAQWLKRATDAVASGLIDGVLIDGNKKNFSAEILKPCSVAKRQSWSNSYAQTLSDLQRALGPNKTIIANLVTPEDLTVSTGGMEEFGATNDWYSGHPPDVASRGIPTIMSWQRKRCGRWNRPCLLDFVAYGSFETELANFLLGVYENAYFGYGGGDGYWGGTGPDACKLWLQDHEEYSKPLGAPHGVATVANSSYIALKCSLLFDIPDATDTPGCVYTRTFANASVYVGQHRTPAIDRHTKQSTNVGSCIFWADGHVTTPNITNCPFREEMQQTIIAALKTEDIEVNSDALCGQRSLKSDDVQQSDENVGDATYIVWPALKNDEQIVHAIDLNTDDAIDKDDQWQADPTLQQYYSDRRQAVTSVPIPLYSKVLRQTPAASLHKTLKLGAVTSFAGLERGLVLSDGAGSLTFTAVGNNATLGFGNAWPVACEQQRRGRCLTAAESAASSLPYEGTVVSAGLECNAPTIWKLRLWADGKASSASSIPVSLTAHNRSDVVLVQADRNGELPSADGFTLEVSALEDGVQCILKFVNISQTLYTGYARSEFVVPPGNVWRAVAEIGSGNERVWYGTYNITARVYL
jgi:hypothetical protein